MAPRASGFTLIEVLVALVVLMTAMGGVASLATAGMRARALARQKTIAALIVVRQLESLRAGLVGPVGAEYFDANGQSVGAAPARSAVFISRWRSSPSPADPATSLIRVKASTIGSDGPTLPLVPSAAPNGVWLVATVRSGS